MLPSRLRIYMKTAVQLANHEYQLMTTWHNHPRPIDYCCILLMSMLRCHWLLLSKMDASSTAPTSNWNFAKLRDASASFWKTDCEDSFKHPIKCLHLLMGAIMMDHIHWCLHWQPLTHRVSVDNFYGACPGLWTKLLQPWPNIHGQSPICRGTYKNDVFLNAKLPSGYLT